MTKTQLVQAEMIKAMKEKNPERKEVLSLLLAALKAKAKDKREDLTPDEEDAVVLKEIKSTKETLESAPAERTDIIEQCRFKLSILGEFAPESMGEEEILAAIQGVLADLGITEPSPKVKGQVMKKLMPILKGKADGSLVTALVDKALQA